MKAECDCIFEPIEKDCFHCDGTGNDLDFFGCGFCGYCSGKGYKMVQECEYMCDECSDKMDEITNGSSHQGEYEEVF